MTELDKSTDELLEMAETLLDKVPADSLKEEVRLLRRPSSDMWRKGKHLYIR